MEGRGRELHGPLTSRRHGVEGSVGRQPFARELLTLNELPGRPGVRWPSVGDALGLRTLLPLSRALPGAQQCGPPAPRGARGRRERLAAARHSEAEQLCSACVASPAHGLADLQLGTPVRLTAAWPREVQQGWIKDL